jgi:hypothetical protein
MRPPHKPIELVKAVLVIAAIGGMFIVVLHNITALLP